MLYCFQLCGESVPLASEQQKGSEAMISLHNEGVEAILAQTFGVCQAAGSDQGWIMFTPQTKPPQNTEWRWDQTRQVWKHPPPIFATKFSINRTAQSTYLRQNAQNNNKQHFTGTQYVLLSIKCSQTGAVIHHHPTCYISDWNILYNTALPSCPQRPSQEILNQPHNCHVTEQIANQNIFIYPWYFNSKANQKGWKYSITQEKKMFHCRSIELIYSNLMKMSPQIFCCSPEVIKQMII